MNDHLCLAACPYPARCPVCRTCVPAAGLCRECALAARLLPPRPKGRGLEGVRRELGL